MGSRSARVATTALLLSFCLSLPAGGESRLRRTVTERFWSRSSPGDSLSFDLPGRWIDLASVLATAGSETLRAGQDFEVEPAEGILRLERALGDSTLRVVYRVVPLGLPRIYQTILPPDTAGSRLAPLAPQRGRIDRWTSDTRLEVRGSKTIGLELGTGQDITVRQSLDVALSGEIVEGVHVRGVLSDRQTPLQPEGRTTELSDLDRVYLRVEGPGAQMTLGDFKLQGPPGLFTTYERQLEGIDLRLRRGGARIGLAAATVPGEFVQIEFLAEEGKQGPYRLRAEEVTSEAVVLAGSETVWLDGEKLVRGEDRDYVIDYAAATLTFSGQRIVGKDSRITVDLQISSQSYRRNTYAVEVGWRAIGTTPGSERFSMRMSLLTERDDLRQPVGGPLTDREKELLAVAGDSLTADLASGVDCRSPGYGPEHIYQQVESDSLDRPFFRYVGPDSGSCRVRFDDVGEGRGDYADSLLSDSLTIYQYVGYRQGRFLPGRAVPRPIRHDLLDLAGRWVGPAGFSIEVEAAGTYDDPNALSGKDDQDRQGGALLARLERDLLPVRIGGVGFGAWGGLIESRDLESRFRPVSRIDPGWYGYGWGLAQDRLTGADRRRTLELTNEPGFGLRWVGRYETLSNRDDLEGERSRLLVRRSGEVHGGIDHLRAKTRDRSSGRTVGGHHSVDQADIGIDLSRIEGAARYRSERSEKGSGEEQTGSGFDEGSVRAAYRFPIVEARLELVRTERRDRLLDPGGWSKGDRARTWKARADWSPAGRLLEARYTRRELFAVSGATNRSDLAGLLWSQDQGGGRFGQRINATLNTTVQEGRVKSIEYVGPGKGRYDSLGVYIGTGDYDLVLIASGESELQRRFEASWRIDLAPGRGATPAAKSLFDKVWKSSQWLLYATFSSRTTGSASQFWTDWFDLLFAHKEGVPLAAHNIRMEVSSLPRARWASPQLRARRERIEEHLFENVQTRKLRDLLSLTLRSLPAAGWTIEQELEVDREEEATKRLDHSGSGGTIGWRSARLRLGSWWRPRPAWTIRVAAIGRERDRIPSGDRYEIVQVVPGLQWIFRDRGRIDLRATRTWIDRPPETILGLEKAGWQGRANISVRLRSSLDFSLIGDLRAPQGSATVTNLRAELRALF